LLACYSLVSYGSDEMKQSVWHLSAAMKRLALGSCLAASILGWASTAKFQTPTTNDDDQDDDCRSPNHGSFTTNNSVMGSLAPTAGW
jgi:hypothetical protein